MDMPAAVTAKASPKSNTVMLSRDLAPAAAPTALKDFQKTATAAKRQVSFARSWTNPSTKLTYPDDHSTLKITMRKTPNMLNGPGHITTHKKTLERKPDKDRSDWVCVTQEVNLTADSTSFLNNDYSDANSHLYPGAIFTFDNFYTGDYKEQIGARNPTMLYTDNPNITGSSGVTVKDPNQVTIRDAIATIYHRLHGPAGNESTTFQVIESFNSADLNMQISGGASGFGVSFSDTFSEQNDDNTIALTIDARKTLFSVGVLPPDDGFFTDPTVESTPNLMVISNVSYGMRVLANLNVTFQSTLEADDFKASYSGLGYSANGVFDFMEKHSSSTSTINGYVVGGASSATKVTFSPKGFLNELNKLLETVTYENARPVTYQFMNMAGDIVGSQSATDTFKIRQCAPATTNPKAQNILVEFDSGGDGKDWNTNLNVYLYPADYIPNPEQDDMVGAAYGYQSQGHSSAFGGGQTNYVYMRPGNGVAPGNMLTRNDLNKGAHVRMHIYPDGNDTWDIQKFTLNFNFEDGTSQPYSPERGFVVSQNVTSYDIMVPAGSMPP